MSTNEDSDITALFGVFLVTKKHLNIMRLSSGVPWSKVSLELPWWLSWEALVVGHLVAVLGLHMEVTAI